MASPIHCLCINLPECTERRQRTEDWWRPILGPALSFEPGVPKAAVPADAAFTSQPPGFIPRHDTRGAVACLMARLNLIRKILRDDLASAEGVVTMEDDAVPTGVDPLAAIAAARSERPDLDLLIMAPLWNSWRARVSTHLCIERPGIRSWPGSRMTWYSRKGLETYEDVWSSWPDTSDSFYLWPNHRIAALFRPVAGHDWSAPSCIGYGPLAIL